MKKVKFNKKLQLNKETISNLNNDQMNQLQGGTSLTKALTYCGGRTCINWGATCLTNCPAQCIPPLTFDGCASADCGK